MSGLPTACYRVSCPPVDAAIAKARAVIDAWLAREDPALGEWFGGWTAVSLGEGIARAILEAEGRDVDDLEEMLDEAELKGGWTEGDVVAEWERRSRP